MDAFANSSSRRWSYNSLKNLREISPVVQNHLKKARCLTDDFVLSKFFYNRCSISFICLWCCALVASAIGSYLHTLWNIGGFLTTVGCMGSTVWLHSTPIYEKKKRLTLLMASALLQGTSIGPLIKLAIDFDPRILVGAFVGCSVACGCFSAAAIIARRREYLYLGALLSSGLSMLLWSHFASSIFGGSTALFNFSLYFGLLVFVGYIIFDTQTIIEEAHLGDLDYVKHALTLFTDFIALFVRILIIMLKNSSEKEEKKKRRTN